MTFTAAHATVVVDGGYELAEGGRWFDGRFVYVDILSGRLFELSHDSGPAAPRQLARLDVPLGAVAPVGDRPDAWIAAAGTGIARLTADGALQWLDRPEDRTPVPSRMNDGVADPAGRFWAGSMAYDGTRGAGSLYRTDRSGTVVRVLDGLTIANGPAFTSDGTTMYLADTAVGTILRRRVDPVSGDLSGGPQTFARLHDHDGEGSPDGMTVDAEGCLWGAMWGAGAVRRYHPDGRLLHTLTVPTPPPRVGVSAPQRQPPVHHHGPARVKNPTAASGAVLSVPVPVGGTAACSVAGRGSSTITFPLFDHDEHDYDVAIHDWSGGGPDVGEPALSAGVTSSLGDSGGKRKSSSAAAAKRKSIIRAGTSRASRITGPPGGSVCGLGRRSPAWAGDESFE
ncbi:SMP-30/gluconolactonase/LRE family protein [Streptomyces sp. NPDC006602]|uniref:SMP-30/gluconolactonase/LRE family protein n=1 Tax=Streptomyces sp. NPDC006602 TaxID=3364751 RepID=UPI0036BB20A4